MFEGKKSLLSDIRATVKINLLFSSHTGVKREQKTSLPGLFPCKLGWVGGGKTLASAGHIPTLNKPKAVNLYNPHPN